MKKILALAVLIFPGLVQANVLFEGWFEVYIGAKKVGFLVERYEFTDNKFKAVSYLKTNKEGNDITESLKAYSGPDLKPISYAYTYKGGEEVKVIDATFKGEVMNLKINDGKKETKQTKMIKKGTFLSTFLLYLILQQKTGGLKTGADYSYNAIAEEDGTAYTGSSLVSTLDKVKGRDAYKILNQFKGEKFFTWVTPKGEILLTRSPEKNIELRFADNQAQATKDMIVNLQDLKLLFGKIPGDTGAGAGGDKELEEKKKKLFDKPPTKPGKFGGLPGGQGIEIKGAPTPSATPQ